MRDGFNLRLGRASYCSLKIYTSLYSIFIFVFAVMFAIGERQNDIMGLRLEHFGIKICLCPELCITTNLEMAAKGEGKKQMQFDCFFNLPPSYKTCFRNGHQADLASRR